MSTSQPRRLYCPKRVADECDEPYVYEATEGAKRGTILLTVIRGAAMGEQRTVTRDELETKYVRFTPAKHGALPVSARPLPDTTFTKPVGKPALVTPDEDDEEENDEQDEEEEGDVGGNAEASESEKD